MTKEQKEILLVAIEMREALISEGGNEALVIKSSKAIQEFQYALSASGEQDDEQENFLGEVGGVLIECGVPFERMSNEEWNSIFKKLKSKFHITKK